MKIITDSIRVGDKIYESSCVLLSAESGNEENNEKTIDIDFCNFVEEGFNSSANPFSNYYKKINENEYFISFGYNSSYEGTYIYNANTKEKIKVSDNCYKGFIELSNDNWLLLGYSSNSRGSIIYNKLTKESISFALELYGAGMAEMELKNYVLMRDFNSSSIFYVVDKENATYKKYDIKTLLTDLEEGVSNITSVGGVLKIPNNDNQVLITSMSAKQACVLFDLSSEVAKFAGVNLLSSSSSSELIYPIKNNKVFFTARISVLTGLQIYDIISQKMFCIESPNLKPLTEISDLIKNRYLFVSSYNSSEPGCFLFDTQSNTLEKIYDGGHTYSTVAEINENEVLIFSITSGNKCFKYNFNTKEITEGNPYYLTKIYAVIPEYGIYGLQNKSIYKISLDGKNSYKLSYYSIKDGTDIEFIEDKNILKWTSSDDIEIEYDYKNEKYTCVKKQIKY